MATTKTIKRKKTFRPEDEPGMMLHTSEKDLIEIRKHIAADRAKAAAKKKKSSAA